MRTALESALVAPGFPVSMRTDSPAGVTINVPAPADAPAAIGFKPQVGETGGYGGASRTMEPGAPWTLCITPGPTQYLYVSDAYPGRIYKLDLDGKVSGEGGFTAAAFLRGHDDCFQENCLSCRKQSMIS